METKINEEIIQISGIETKPFCRYVGKINLDELLKKLTDNKLKYELDGYSNLELSINEDCGIIDIYLFGDRNLIEEEIDIRERIAVIGRIKDKTSKGLTRDELLNM